MWTAIDNYWRTASQHYVVQPHQDFPSTPHEEEDKPTTADRLFHAVMAQFTAGLSPASLAWLILIGCCIYRSHRVSKKY